MGKPSLNRFLRECIAAGSKFNRIKVIRTSKGVQWNNYFPKGVPVTFEKVAGTTDSFYVSTTRTPWICSKSAGDCEILFAELTPKGVVISIGEGFT